MNSKSRLHFDMIKDAEEAYMKAMTGILAKYRQKKTAIKAKAADYKNENEMLARWTSEAKQEARSAIAAAEDKFRDSLKKASAGLHDELRNAISEPVKAGFTERVALYRSAGVAPGRMEAEALLSLAERNPVALTVLGKLLEDVKAPVRLTGKTISDYERDLAELDALAAGPLLHGPGEYHVELCEIMKGSRKLSRLSNGSWAERGHVWEGSVDILATGGGVVNSLKMLERISDSWVADIKNEIAEADAAEQIAKEREEAELAGREYTEPAEPTPTAAIAENNSAIETAKQLGREAAGVDTATALARYMR